jgi:hypothetical protein
MVFIVDAEGTFDAPIEKIWRFLNSPPSSHTHPMNRNVQSEVRGEVVTLSFENDIPGGGIVKQKLKMTMMPPVGMLTEYLEGPLTGSKSIQYYVPKGNKTDVVVAGEFTSNVLPEGQLNDMVLQQMDAMFKEDQENLKRFA